MFKKIIKLFSPKGKTPPVSNGRAVLVVDDGEVERHTAQRILEKAGYEVFLAKTGEEGYQTAQDKRPDIVILDCFLPGISGPEVCKLLKTNELTKDIPVIFLTGSDTPTNIINCYDLGGEQFLAKPVDAKTLLKQIQITLDQHV